MDLNCINRNFVSQFDVIYTEDFKKKNRALKQHHLKYINDKYAPAWKTLEYLTFGTILKLFKSLKDKKLKTKIVESFGMISIQKFELLMDTVLYLRNACAHGNVLFDLAFPKGIPSLPFLSVNNNQRHQLHTGIRVVSYFLCIISTNRKNEFEVEINKHFNNVKNEDVISIISNKIGVDIC